jgi:phosphate-selective porin OprO/OprP
MGEHFMRHKACFLTAAVLAGFLLLGLRPAFAETQALKKMLEVFERKGILNAEEVQVIRQAASEDLRELETKEKELKARENELNRREKKLLESENSPPSAANPPVEVQASAEKAPAGIALGAYYDRGVCLGAADPYDLSLCLGGLLQVDYRYYNYDEGNPNNNSFDIRRARLQIGGHALRHFDYRFLYEFSGAQSRNLLDAYMDFNALPWMSLRAGQFKEPFSLEQLSSDSDLFFAERSMAYYLTPRRDIGIMAHASLFDDRFGYGVGVFNGRGLDDSVGGDSDAPQVTGRLWSAPFRNHGIALADDLRFGVSASSGKIDRNGVTIQVDTTGMTRFLDVSPNAKFAIIQDADRLDRYGLEMAWAWGPLGIMSEYVANRYQNIETSSDEFDLNLDDFYVALFWMLTGEEPTFRYGVMQPIRPLKNFGEGGWGAFGLALRYDRFAADQVIYGTLVEPGNSVRKADAYTAALNWYLNPFVRFLVDFTFTEFDRPLLIDRNSNTGEATYSDWEAVITARLQFAF